MPSTPQSAPRTPAHFQQSTGLILIGAILLTIVVVGLVSLIGSVVALYPQLPDTSGLAHYRPKQPLRVYTADGIEIGGFGSEKRQYLRFEQIPKLMRDSLLAVEDARFYDHGGIDLIGVMRATFSNLTGHHMQGASTITQQVARTFLLTREKTLSRKLKEAMLSLKIERELSKDQILTLYMNEIYLGARAYGFAEAAQTYFGKPLSALSPAECAMLAGLPQNPAYANPIKNLDRAMARQRVALMRMRTQAVITEQQYQKALAQKLVIRNPNDMDVHAEYVAEMARQQVFAQYGDATYTTGMKVFTTLRANEQQAAYSALRKALIDREFQQAWRGPEAQEDLDTDLADTDPAIAQTLAEYSDDEVLHAAVLTKVTAKQAIAVLASGEVVQVSTRGLRRVQSGLGPKAPEQLKLSRGSVVRLMQQGKDWVIGQWPEAEGAVVAMDPHDGEVHALVGGFDFKHNQFNHVTQGWRQPGSSYKPFLYAAALENGVMPETLINDAPLTDVGNWNPQNADGSADGPITLQQALVKSKNLVSIRLVQLMGPNMARQYTAKFGFDASKQPDNLTLALGAGSTTPMQMVEAYAVIANGGLHVNPVVIKRVSDANSKVVFEADTSTAGEEQRVVPERNVFVLSTMLNEVTRTGTAARAQAQLKRPDLYGKTGTTNDVVDAWFAGFQPDLAAVVWIGYDTPRSLGNHSSGASLALPVWIQFMSTALAHEPVRDLIPTEGVVRVNDNWRYTEWAYGGFVQSLGLDGQSVTHAMIPAPPSSAPSEADSPRTNFWLDLFK